MFAVVTQEPGRIVYVESAEDWEAEADSLVNAHTDWCETSEEAQLIADKLRGGRGLGVELRPHLAGVCGYPDLGAA